MIDPIVQQLAQVIVNKKGSNITALDLRGVSSLTDYFLIAEGRVERHVQGIAREIERTLKKSGRKPLRIEGMDKGDWVVIDCWDLMIHLFIPSMRAFYQLERVWEAAKVIDLELDYSSASSEWDISSSLRMD